MGTDFVGILDMCPVNYPFMKINRTEFNQAANPGKLQSLKTERKVSRVSGCDSDWRCAP